MGRTFLQARRDRRGAPRPFLVGLERGRDRRVVVAGTGSWRWAARGGPALRAYEGWVAAAAGWLLEESAAEAVELAGLPLQGHPLGWRVAPGVDRLSVAVRDSAGETVWASDSGAGAATLSGPALEAGDYRFEARGRGPDGAFRVERPFRVRDDPEERLPRALPPPLRLAAARPGDRDPERAEGPRPAWPFVLAAALLCGEWAWRRRIGLR